MCSLSWTRGSRGAFWVVMNRDERRDRAPARPPRRWRGSGQGFTAPLDPEGGGTWIAARDSGVVLALLNHHPPRPAEPPGVSRPSRGRLVTVLAGERGVPDARRLRAAGLVAYAPFRLFVAGPATPPRVFTWDGRTLRTRRLAPALGFLTSSSWNAAAVLPVRHARFRAFARRHAGKPSREALIAFHDQADDPRGTPWAICMSRDDARTVSTTVVEAGRAGVSMRYRRR